MSVNPANSLAPQPADLDRLSHNVIRKLRNHRQVLQKPQRYAAARQITASNLAEDHRVHGDFSGFQQLAQPGIAMAEVIHPDGCVGQNHAGTLSRRRGMGRNFGIDPTGQFLLVASQEAQHVDVLHERIVPHRGE